MVRDFLPRSIWELGSSVRIGGTEEKGEGESFPGMEVQAIPLARVGESEAGDIIGGDGVGGEIDAEGQEAGEEVSSRSPHVPKLPACHNHSVSICQKTTVIKHIFRGNCH